jgi:ketosteroid isomerase-like protein
MAAEDVEAGRRAWEAFASMREPDEILALAATWDPEVEYVEDPKWPGATSFRGFRAVAGRFREYIDDLGSDGEFRLEGVRETPGGLVSLVRVQGRSTSGVPFDHLWAYRFRMRDRRVVWFRAYLDPDEALGGAES